jgi:outer membrane lipoprotein SlyB
MKKVQITATYGATTYPIFSGFITSYVNTQPKDATEVAYTTIQAVDAFRLSQNAQITTVAGATAGDLSGTRVNQILDQIDWPATMRDVDAGQTTLYKMIQAVYAHHLALCRLLPIQSTALYMLMPMVSLYFKIEL